MMDDVLKLGPRIHAIPVVHGSGDFAWELRRLMLSVRHDCLAVPLPPSFQAAVERGVAQLPRLSVAYARESDWSAKSRRRGASPSLNYVPIDPCQPVIAAIRLAQEERIPIRFIGQESPRFRPIERGYPDPYALKSVTLAQFAAAMLPVLERPRSPRHLQRIAHMAFQLKHLCVDFRQIFFPCSMSDWVWLREAFWQSTAPSVSEEPGGDVEWADVHPDTAYFMLGELPFITGRYELARQTLESDANLSIDGVKELLLEARTAYRTEMGERGRTITPKLLKICLQYVRNLSLLARTMTPQLVDIITAAKQVAGDSYALHVLETAKRYPFAAGQGASQVKFGIDHVQLASGDGLRAYCRLPGPPKVWRSIRLAPRPDASQREKWGLAWNPHAQCSWPPEDRVIENFRSAVFDRSRQLLGQDLAKTEKFTSSVKDGIDIRDTLRHWYEGSIYVKVLPPNRGRLDSAVMLFDSPADPREYHWRSTWYAEHVEESTLAFFATDFREQPVGPGICLASYGGVMFLFPPKPIRDVWTDPRFDFAETLEERLIAAACFHSAERHVALLSARPPGNAWRTIAKYFRRRLIHIPLGQFSEQTIQQLRQVHVLNGKKVRSYAARFIRKI